MVSNRRAVSDTLPVAVIIAASVVLVGSVMGVGWRVVRGWVAVVVEIAKRMHAPGEVVVPLLLQSS